MKARNDLKVVSHVGRDLLHAAAAFKTEAAVVWEYVVNGIQYVDKGVTPVIDVSVNPRAKTIVISDNGQGMSGGHLQHFFTMHGENLQRKAGRPGRGKFGTGKSAAFGIANQLEIDTVQGHLRNVVRLTRGAIDASDGREVPVEWLVRDEEGVQPNGTVVKISDILLPRLEATSIIEYIERNLPFFRGSMPQVAVNAHVCEYREPRIVSTYRFEPTPRQAQTIGEVVLVIKVAQAPLPESEQGVAVTAGPGNLVAIERGGVERKEFGAYLFGEVDVLALEMSESGIAPYDASRSLQLNPRHPVVSVLLGFIGSKLDEVRSELVSKERLARQTEAARRLEAEADRIAEILNKDFTDHLRKLTEIRVATARSGPATSSFGSSAEAGEDPDAWVSGVQEPGRLPETQSGQQSEGSRGRPNPHVNRVGERDPQGDDLVGPAGGSGSRRKRPRGGFKVEHRHLGKEEDRSKYDPASMTILINLDHPVVEAALGNGGVEEPGFRRLCYEIAFGEYSIALGYEMAESDPEIPADDLLYEVRTTLNRIARSSAEIYR